MATQNNNSRVSTERSRSVIVRTKDVAISLKPRLRFEEFEGDWKKYKVGELCDCIVPGRNKPKQFEGSIAWITTPDIEHSSYIFSSKSGLGISKEEAKNVGSKIVPKDSVIISCVGDLGLVAIAGVELVINQQLHAFLPSEKVDHRFLMYSITTQNKHIDRVATKTAVPYMNKDNCNSIPIYKTELPEQQKIANFLTAVDTKLQQLTTKKESLEQYKKGVMQQLFSQQLRFKDDDGSVFPDWEEKRYDEIFSFYPTNSFSRDNLNYEIGKIKNIHYGDIHTKFSMLFNIENENVPYINSEIDLSKIKPQNYCQIGDLVIADASEDYNDIGKSIEITNLNKEPLLAGLHTFLARPNKYDMQIGFSSYLMQSWVVRKQIMTIAQGTKVLSLATSRLGRVKLNIPSLKEQQKIATYLSAIDLKIEAVQTQLTQTQEFKKGLLQQMFV